MHVTAVVVAYNRRDLLAESLNAIAAQERVVDSVVVIDNASTDGSAEVARVSLPDADVVVLPRNTGGAGGFAVGIERAITRHSADLVWIMDDDTIPTPTALRELMDARERHSGSPVVVASRAVWTDGSDHPMNTPRAKPFVGKAERLAAEKVDCIPVRSSSFVSSLVATDAIKASGLPCADYFIWNDDFEFTGRLLRAGVGLYCPASVVVHKTKALASTDADPGPRFYFEVRNKLWLFRRSSALAPAELPLYLAASARRWARTFLGSSDRATLRTGLAKGWRDGWTTNPRSNSDALADLGDIGDAVRVFEDSFSRSTAW